MQQFRGGERDGSAFERASQHSSRAGRQDSGRSSFVQSEFMTEAGPPKAAQGSPDPIPSPTLRYAATSEFELLEQSEPQQQ